MSFQSICTIRSKLFTPCFLRVSSNHTSALYVSPDKATHTYAFVVPHIDITDRLKDENTLKYQMKARQNDFNVDKLREVWNFYQELCRNKNILEGKKGELDTELQKLMQQKDADNSELTKFKAQHTIVKENLRNVKRSLWSVEEAAYLRALKLPNVLHERTPVNGEDVEIYKHLDEPVLESLNHLDIGAKLDLIEYSSPESYYLKGDAAIFELGAKFHFNRKLRESSFVQFSNPDFCKSVIVEGCSYDHKDPNSVFILHHNEETKMNPDIRLHLTGGASLFAFAAYHAKNVVHANAFPMQYFAMGRQYKPTSDKLGHGLFSVNQASAIEAFVALKESKEMNEKVEEITNILIDFYKSIGYHFRICYLNADKLESWESLRVSVQMYSPSVCGYVEVANLSVIDDFISKRLMFTYNEKKQQKFPKLLSGTLLHIPKLLGCALEQNVNFTIPEVMHVENWSII